MSRKLPLTFFAFGICLSSIAQVSPLKQGEEANLALPAAQIGITGMEVSPQAVLKPQPASFYAKAVNETEIGETIYDLMSNSSIQSRNLVHSDGTISASYTFGMQATAFADRGAGYNYFNGTSWSPFATARIETMRTGWPSMMSTAAGQETIISHAGSGPFVLNKRASKGTGAWTQALLPTTSGLWYLWPRATTGGANGNSIHCIGITAPTGNGGTVHEGIDGALSYWRSTDQGATWDIVESILSDFDSTHFNSFRADAYSIIADGDKIAIAVFKSWGDMVLLKSTDNGTNWTSQIVNDFPLDLYVADQPGGSDTNGDMVADTIETCDEAGAILFDANGMVHMTFGRMRVLDDETAVGTSYFPGTQELYYWNESMGTGNFMTIAVPEDVDMDGTLLFAGSFAGYFTALCGSPSMGKNTDGTIFVSYAGYREDFESNGQNLRHIYVTKTMDGGTTWATPLDVTPDVFLNYYECAFPTIAPTVDNKLRLMYMRDLEPGLATRGDLDPYDLNSIMYLSADTNLIDDLGLNEISTSLIQTKLFPNPGQDEVNLSINLTSAKQVSLTMTNITGDKMKFEENENLSTGEHSFHIQTKGLPSGVYFVRIEIDGQTRTEKLVVKH